MGNTKSVETDIWTTSSIRIPASNFNSVLITGVLSYPHSSPTMNLLTTTVQWMLPTLGYLKVRKVWEYSLWVRLDVDRVRVTCWAPSIHSDKHLFSPLPPDSLSHRTFLEQFTVANQSAWFWDAAAKGIMLGNLVVTVVNVCKSI